VDVLVGQLAGADVQHGAVVPPRLEAEVAALVVERVPGDVERAVRLRVLEQRPPAARAVAVHSHEVRLRRLAADRLLFSAARTKQRRYTRAEITGDWGTRPQEFEVGDSDANCPTDFQKNAAQYSPKHAISSNNSCFSR